jgi:GTP:adenosylcobinamide-phosphate guanylyltransferase
MKKIYLAKSNNANPNILYKVRSILSKFNVEVVEYSGGSYSHDLLLSCDELIVIPDISKTYNEMFSQLETSIHRFAKRQMTWFRRMEKNGIEI